MESASDAILIEICQQEGRGLVTLDLDFANPLNFRPSEFAGIAVLRLTKNASAVDLLQAVSTLIQGLQQQRLSGKLWIVEIGRIRVYQEVGEA